MKNLRRKGEAVLLFIFFFIFYCFWQTKSIYGGDSGDLVTAAWVWGIPHPPGYPLYSLIASFLAHFLPFFTPAWRVGLISSFSSAAALALFYGLSLRIIREKWICLLATLTLAFLYPFWLYNEVPEVFGLSNLFIILLSFVVLNLFSNFNFKKLKTFAFLFGLSLTHHHTVVLLLPGIAYLFYQNREKLKLSLKNFTFLFISFTGPILLYLYPVLSCRRSPLVCWDSPVNLKNLFRLIFRLDYGTFRSSTSLGEAPLLRIYSLLSGFRFMMQDFSIPGLILVAFGLYCLFKNAKNKKLKELKNLGMFLTITLVACLFFIFYASFMLVNDFMVATFERFLIIPYIFMSLLLGIGVKGVFEKASQKALKFRLSQPSEFLFFNGLKVVFFLIPLSFFVSNFKRISILKDDFTAENMIKDYLRPLPSGSILIMSSDTTVFDGQYVRYVLGYRNDVIVLSYPHLPLPYYKKLIGANFPQIFLSDKEKHQENLREFVEKNKEKYPIFVDGQTFDPQEDWLPFGLARQYLPLNQQPQPEEISRQNALIWEKYGDPLSNSLGKYKNLFLADALRVYQNARIYLGEFLLNENLFDEAALVFEEAEKWKPNNEEVYIGQGIAALGKQECQKAKDLFLKALSYDEKNVLVLGYLRKVALECFKNEKEAKSYEDQCLTIQEKKQTSLQELGQ
ncbi:MAG TPA: DUF2723 domain-containing protein [Candidatus Bathyarchaeia archaeon]|nr:DUF2723 domain-containing protein [Candidatus Bathyarchaeia archaeon]